MSVNIVPGKGFQLTFKNGRTLSCMFGYGNYCENRNKREYVLAPEVEVPEHSSTDFEIAGWPMEHRPWVNFGCDEVKGWVDLKHVVEFGKFLRDADDIRRFKVDRDHDTLQIRLSTNRYPDCVAVRTDNGSWTPLFWGDSEAEYALGMLELCLECINGENR